MAQPELLFTCLECSDSLYPQKVVSHIGEISLGRMLVWPWQHAVLVCFTRASSSSFYCRMRTEHRYCLRQNWLSLHYLAQHDPKATTNPQQTRTGGGDDQKMTETGLSVNHQALSHEEARLKRVSERAYSGPEGSRVRVVEAGDVMPSYLLEVLGLTVQSSEAKIRHLRLVSHEPPINFLAERKLWKAMNNYNYLID